eukprot:scaffold22564_cov67-Phaeocystis_antarctica.AAC.8
MGHVQRHEYVPHVQGALHACPHLQPRVRPSPCIAPPSVLPPPGPYLFPHRMPAFRLGRPRRRSTSRSASTRPASRPCAPCSTCAPRVPWPSQSLPPNALTPLPGRTSLPASHARLSTRQEAKAFNQPLSFDTSKVTDMQGMFQVRSARALPPQP